MMLADQEFQILGALLRRSVKMIESWLLDALEPWTRYRTRLELLDQPESDVQVQAEREKMLADLRVQALLRQAAWPGYALKRHNDAQPALHKLGMLADFGLRRGDPGIDALLEAILARQSAEAAFQSLVSIPAAFGGSGEEEVAFALADFHYAANSAACRGITFARSISQESAR